MLVLILIGGVLLAQEEKAEVSGEPAAQEEKAEEPEPEGDVAAGGQTFSQVVVAGGWAMLFIGICSVLAFGLAIERFVHMRPSKMVPSQFVGEVRGFVEQGRYDEAGQRCEETPSPISNVLGVMFERMREGKDATVVAVEDAGAKVMAGLQQKISYLSVIAVISPMIGLLGTVLGMIQAFNVIAFQAGLGKPTLLAAGISKALVTTAAGLIVAIPAMIFYHLLRTKIQTIMTSIEKISEKFIGLIFSSPTVGPATEEVTTQEQEIVTEEETIDREREEEEEAEREARRNKEEEILARKKEEERKVLVKKKEENDLFRKGKESYAKGDFKGAMTLFQKVLEVNPDNENSPRYIEKARAIIEQAEKEIEA